MNNYVFPLGRRQSIAILAFLFLYVSALAQIRPGGGGAGAKKPTPSRTAAKGNGGAMGQKRSNNASLGSNNKGRNEAKSGGRNGKGGNGNFSNKKVDIDKSRGDVNINVDNSKDIKINNSRNTAIRRNTFRPYTRPPLVYGGFHYRCFHPYFYHPYRPFYWGPVWHPWGFFLATLTATAIIVSFADVDLPPGIITPYYFATIDALEPMAYGNMRSGPSLNDLAQQRAPEVYTQENGEYYFDQGVFYLKSDGGYTSVAAPLGAVVKSLPAGFETVSLDESGTVKNYYWGGTFYEKISNGYKVVPPTSGAVVEHLAEGGEEVKLGEVTYVKLGETYYQPIQQNGKNMYEVVDVEKAN